MRLPIESYINDENCVTLPCLHNSYLILKSKNMVKYIMCTYVRKPGFLMPGHIIYDHLAKHTNSNIAFL